MLAHEDFGHRHHVLGLAVEQPDGLDVRFQALLTEVQHVLRRLHLGKQRARRLVHPTSVACAESVTATSN